MQYYLASWEWSSVNQCWQAPFSSHLGNIDFRTKDQRSMAGGVPQGYALFATARAETVSDAILLPSMDIRLTREQISMLEQEFGLGETLLATTLKEAIEELLIQHADPTVNTRWGNIWPTHKGQMEVWLAGEKLLSRPFVKTGSEWAQIVMRHQHDYRLAHSMVQSGRYASDQHRKILGGWVRKYGVLDYEQFIPSDLPSVSPLPPESMISDDFNRADENLENDANWSLLLGVGGVASLAIVANEVRDDLGSTNRSFGLHGTALSSADHYSQVKVTTLNTPSSARNDCGAVGRLASDGSGNADGYVFQATKESGGALRGRTLEMNAGSPTVKGDTLGAPTVGDTVRIECSGSTMTPKINGSAQTEFTDTTHSAHITAGIEVRSQTAVSVADSEIDDFEAADLAGRIMSSLTAAGGLAGMGGIAGRGGGLAS